jgi:putative nucleotidyltransferase with HDIG domain/PAS domain S-box-containing protein
MTRRVLRGSSEERAVSDRTLAEAHVLVVDDEASIVRLFVRALQSAGYSQVHGTTDSSEVLALLDSFSPDLVIMDLNMPGLDGFALLKQISGRLSQDTFLPVLTVSGMSDPEAKERAFRAGAKDYLTKPVNIQELILHANSLLEMRFLSLRLHQNQDELAKLVGRRTEELQLSVGRRRQAEEALEEKERQLDEARRLARMGMWSWDIATDTATWSQELFDIVGREPSEGAPSREEYHALLSPDSSALLDRATAEALESCIPYEEELEMLRPDGTSCHLLMRGGVLRDDTGQVVRIAGTVQDVTERWKSRRELANTVERLEESQAMIIRALSEVSERRDPYTAHHARRVKEISVAIARQMGLPEEQVGELETAALLHDIGKISVPIEILSNPGTLSHAQRALVEEHVASGYEILGPIPFLGSVAEAVLQHHERLDGSGYPSGLKGDEIVLESRILAVADVLEAMTSHRPYRAALGPGVAVAELVANRGVLYDPVVVDAYLELSKEELDLGTPETDPNQLRFIP